MAPRCHLPVNTFKGCSALPASLHVAYSHCHTQVTDCLELALARLKRDGLVRRRAQSRLLDGEIFRCPELEETHLPCLQGPRLAVQQVTGPAVLALRPQKFLYTQSG